MSDARISAVRAAALGIAAFAIACVAHEVIGHGAGCLGSAGTVVRMNTVVFRCMPPSNWADVGGPAGGAVCALLAWRRIRSPRASALAVLVFAFAALWFGGYLVYSAALERGDLAFVATSFVPRLRLPARILEAIVGVAIYGGALRVMRPWLPERRVCLIAWAAASIAVVLSTLARGVQGDVLRDALQESALASSGMLFVAPRTSASSARGAPTWCLALFGIAVLAIAGRGL